MDYRKEQALRRLMLVLAIFGAGALLAGGTASSAPQAAPAWWAGLWDTDYGLMKVSQTGANVTAHYGTNMVNNVKGTVSGNVLTGTWTEGSSTGKVHFTISPDGATFTGKYGSGAEPPTKAWNGKNRNHTPKPGTVTGSKPAAATASFAGVWTTDYGVMKITQTGDKVTGKYGTTQTNTIAGTVVGKVLRGTWKEGTSTGALRFNISSDGKSFVGIYGTGAEPPTHKWNGHKA